MHHDGIHMGESGPRSARRLNNADHLIWGHIQIEAEYTGFFGVIRQFGGGSHHRVSVFNCILLVSGVENLGKLLGPGW